MGWANRRNRIVTSPVASDRALPLETLDECCVRSGFRIRRWLPTGNPSHSSSGRPRPTRWREWLGSRTPKGDATWRVFPSSSAISANRYPPARIKSGPASKTRKSFPDPFAYLRESAAPALGFSGSAEDVRDDVTADIGESKIPSGIAIGEFLVIESE